MPKALPGLGAAAFRRHDLIRADGKMFVVFGTHDDGAVFVDLFESPGLPEDEWRLPQCYLQKLRCPAELICNLWDVRLGGGATANSQFLLRDDLICMDERLILITSRASGKHHVRDLVPPSSPEGHWGLGNARGLKGAAATCWRDHRVLKEFGAFRLLLNLEFVRSGLPDPRASTDWQLVRTSAPSLTGGTVELIQSAPGLALAPPAPRRLRGKR